MYSGRLVEKSFIFTHFKPIVHFYTPWKNQKTSGDDDFAIKSKILLFLLYLICLPEY